MHPSRANEEREKEKEKKRQRERLRLIAIQKPVSVWEKMDKGGRRGVSGGERLHWCEGRDCTGVRGGWRGETALV